MSKYLDDLIFDRTVEDIRNLTDKAYIDYKDLNRVESAVKWISYVLNRYGYRNTTHNKVNWEMNEWRTEADMIRLRDNINTIRDVFFCRRKHAFDPGENNIHVYLPGQRHRKDYL